MHFAFCIFFHCFLFCTSRYFCSGTCASYEQSEKKHAFITHLIIRTSMYTVLMCCGATAMFPLAYVCFGYPEPHQWILPYELHTLLNGNVYISYYTDVFIQFFTCSIHPIVMITPASFYLGMCLYKNAMVADLAEQIATIRLMTKPKLDKHILRRLKREIYFHRKIIKW